MSDYEEDIQMGLPFHLRGGERDDRGGSNCYPAKPNELISRIFYVDTEQMLDIFAQLDSEQAINELKTAISNLEPASKIEGEININQEIRTQIGNKLNECLKYVNRVGIDLECQKQNSFRKALGLLIRSFSIKQKDDILKQIWSILTTTTSYQVFKVYIGLLHELLDSGQSSDFIMRFERRAERRRPEETKSGLKLEIKAECDRLLANWAQYGGLADRKFKVWTQEGLAGDQKLIIKLYVLASLQTLSSKTETQSFSDALNAEIKEFFVNHESFELVQAITKFKTDLQICGKFCEALLSSKFDSATKVFKPEELSPNLVNEKNLNHIIEGNPMRILMNIRKESVVFEPDCIYSRFSINNLKLMKKGSNGPLHSENLSYLRVCLKKLLENQALPIKAFNQEQNRIQFICQVFKILVFTLKPLERIERNTPEQGKLCYETGFVDSIVTNFASWASAEELKKQNFLQDCLGQIIEYVYIETLRNISSQPQIKERLVRFCMDMITTAMEIPKSWSIIKKLRLVIEHWTTLNNQDPEKVSIVTLMLLNAYFSSECSLSEETDLRFEGIYSPSEEYRSIFSKYVLEKVQKFAEAINSNPLFMYDEASIYDYNVFVFKLHILIRGKFEFTTVLQIGEILHKIYGKYAHVLPKLFHLRTWINHFCQPESVQYITENTNKLANQLSAIKFIRDKNLSSLECLERELPSYLPNRENERRMFVDFVNGIQELQNNLDLKNCNQVIPEETYRKLILGLIKPLSDVCEVFYNKILDRVLVSKEEAENVNKILTRNCIYQEKSIYGKLTTIFFDLKMTIRLYLNNITRVITFPEASSIAKILATLFQDVDTQNERKKRNAVQLLNDMMSGESWKKETRLSYTQSFQTSDTYKSVADRKLFTRLNKQTNSYLSVVVPLFVEMGSKFDTYLRLFTEMKEAHSQDNFRFNHQVGFENQIKKCIPNRDSFEFARKNTMTSHSKELFRLFFLPPVVLKTEGLKKVGLNFYLKQLKTLFANDYYFQFIRDYTPRVLSLYKTQSIIPTGDLTTLTQNSLDEPETLGFGIEPIEQADFRAEIKELINSYFKIFVEKAYDKKESKLGVQDVYELLNSFSQDANPQPQNQLNLLTLDDFLWSLVEKGNQKLKQILEQEIASNEQQDEPESEESEEEEQEAQMSRNRLVIAHERAEKRKKKQEARRSPLSLFISVLNLLRREKKEALIRRVYREGIQLNLLKYVEATKREYDFRSICSFINDIFPELEQEINQASDAELIKYYKLVLESIRKSKYKNNNSFISLLLKLQKQAKSMKRKNLLAESREFSSKLYEICEELVNSQKPISSDLLTRLLKNMFECNDEFSNVNLEFKIKYFVLSCYERSKRKGQEQEKDQNQFEFWIEPNHIQVGVENYLEVFRQEIKNDEAQFYQITRRVFEGWVSSNRLVFTKGLPALSECQYNGKKFVTYSPPKKLLSLVSAIISSYVSLTEEKARKTRQLAYSLESIQNQEEKKKFAKAFSLQNDPSFTKLVILEKLVRGLLQNLQLLIPRIVQIKVNSTRRPEGERFVDWLINQCLQTLDQEKVGLLVMLMNRNGLILDYGLGKTYCQYIAATILENCLKQIRSPETERKYPISSVVYLVSTCLGIKQFNELSTTRGSPTLLQEMEKLFDKFGCQSMRSIEENPESTKFQSILYQQCLNMIYKYLQTKDLLAKNKSFLGSRHPGLVDISILDGSRAAERLRKYVNDQAYQTFNKDKWWESLTDIISTIAKESSADLNQQQITQQQSTMQQTEQSQPNLQKLANSYKTPKQAENLRNFPSVPVIQTNSMPRRFDELNKELKMFVENKNVTVEDVLKKNKIGAAGRRKMRDEDEFFERRMIRRIDFEDDDDIEDFIQGRRRRNQRTQAINPLEFIKNLEKIEKNSENFKQGSPKKPKKSKSKKSEKSEMKEEKKREPEEYDDQETMLPELPQICNRKISAFERSKSEQTVVEEEELTQNQKKLRQNENYKKLAEMSYYDRIKFLMTAQGQFFDGLPAEVLWDIVQESRMLKRQKKRQEDEKQRSRRQDDGGEVYEGGIFGEIVRRDRFAKKEKEVQKLQKVQQKEELAIPDEIIVKVLKGLFIQVIKQKGQEETIRNRLSNLLLQIGNNKIKHKVLTTLIIMLHNADKIKITYYKKEQENKWKSSHRPEGMLSERANNRLKIKILNIINSSLTKALFDNSDLVTTRLSTSSYYSEVFASEGIQDLNLAFQSELGANEDTYLPINELLNLSFEAGHPLAEFLITRVTDLPDVLANKMFQLMVKGKFSDQFFNNLNSVAKNKRLTQLFATKFSLQSPPPLPLLGKVLKYQFGKVSYAKDLHKEALKNYKVSYNRFLAEVLALYSEEQLLQKESLFVEHRKIYCEIIKQMYRKGYRISESPIYKLLKLNGIFDYKAKEGIFRNNMIFSRVDLTDLEDPFSQILHINPKQVFASSYNQLMSLTPNQIKRKIGVSYIDTPDGSGIGYFRIWTQELFANMQKFGMLIPIDRQGVYQPSPQAKKENRDFLSVFKFLGRILATVVLQNQVFPCAFPTSFYKNLMNLKVVFTDLQEINPSLWSLIKSTKEALDKYPQMDLADMNVEITFTYKGKNMVGEDVEKELKPNGKDILVTRATFDEFINLVAKQVVFDFCLQEYESIKQGFLELIPPQALQILNEKDLEFLISGVPEFNLEEFERCTQFLDYTREDKVIKWFWEIVKESTPEERAQIVQFWNGSSRLPYGGFEAARFTIQKGLVSDIRLPSAATCAKALVLPQYSSKEILRNKLFQGIAMEQR